MELSRQEYPALLPLQAVNVFNDRLKHIGSVTTDVSEWLAERRKVEEAYAQGLRKLAASRPDNLSSWGVFRESWQSIVGSCEGYADSHATFAKKIEVDIEKQLSEFTAKGKDMSHLTTIQGNLASLAKNVDQAQQKSNKMLSKGNKADSSKLSAALSGVQDAQTEWESQAPYIFEQLQALDENRVNHLRDALTQLQTHEVDHLQRSRTVAESTLNTVLTTDTGEEISTFVAAISQGAPSLQQRRQSRHSTNLSTGSAGPAVTATPGGSVPPLPQMPPTLPQVSSLAPPPSQPVEDNRSERSAATTEPRPSESRSGAPPPTPSPEKKKSGFGGLRRLGTVIGRRKTESKPTPPPPVPEKKAEKKTKSRRNPLRRGSSSRNSMYQLNSPSASATELADTSARPQSESARNRSVAEGTVAANSVTREETSTASTSLSNGPVLSHREPERKPRPPSTIQEEGEHLPSASGPSSAVDDITRAQQEAAAFSDDQPQFKLDIKNEPIQEEGGDSAQALSNVANTLRGAQPPPARRSGTLRGRRDVRNTVFVPNNVAPENVVSASNDTLAPLTTNSPAVLRSPDDTRSADAQSIRSAHSLSSLSHGAVKHADMHELGLNASIVETISATFSGGVVTKAIAIGEIALVYNPTPPAPGAPPSSASSETVRLENFSALEKVAPNPVLVSPIPGKNGEYTADLIALSKPQVSFKYQVHLDESNIATQAPVLLTPSWKVEPTQTSVIISYAYNPSYSSDSKSVTLSNFVIAVSLDGSGAKASTCQSKPPGTFSREKNLIYWRLGDVALSETHEGPPLRLLARFATDGEAKPGGVEARWEISSTNSLGCGSGLGVSYGPISTRDASQTDPFADGSTPTTDALTEWKPCAVQRRITSGKYVAS